MKIVYVSASIVPSRTANSVHVMKMCAALAAVGHDIVLLTRARHCRRHADQDDFSSYAVERNFRIKKLPFPPVKGGRLLFGWAIRRVLQKEDPHLVYGRYVTGCSIAARRGYPVVYEAHVPIWYRSRPEQRNCRALMNNGCFRRMIVISDKLKRAYLDYGMLDENRIVVAHDAADEVMNGKEIANLAGRTGVLQVGYAGHLYDGKGMEVVEAIASKLPDVDFHIVGGMPEDVAKWEKRIISPNVTFHGYVNHARISEFIRAFDVCLLPNQKVVLAHGVSPSRQQYKNIGGYTSPLKMFEYMAHAKAIVASDLPVLREVLNDSNALLVDPEDHEGWCAAISKLNDVNLRSKLGNRAHSDFKSTYTWRQRAKKVLADINL